MKSYDVVIVGAGPAGLFAADTLANSGKKLSILVVDKGKDILKRECPAQTTMCMKCDPCNMLCGVGGAGGLSDGKLNLKYDIGGDLSNFVEKKEAGELVEHVDRTFLRYGAPNKLYPPPESRLVEEKAVVCRLEFVPIPQRHVGSDKLVGVIAAFREDLEKKGVQFRLNTEVLDVNVKKKAKVLSLKGGKKIQSKFVIFAVGRSGAIAQQAIAEKHGIRTSYLPFDIGVRVEVPARVLSELTSRVWDPKFRIVTDTYKDTVRTFCTCPNGFVVEENYGSYVSVNGHSMNSTKSDNTNFALLCSFLLTEPVENTIAYGESIAKMATNIGGGKPIVQRLGDLKAGRRSNWERINKNPVQPTLNNFTPGDISMALPGRIVTNILDALGRLDCVVEGIADHSTLLYAPEIKLYNIKVACGKSLETSVEGLFVAGDGAGLSRGIVTSAATGVIAAHSILAKI